MGLTPINYYNENDPKAAAWLKQLIKDGLIPDGVVDERSILDVQPGDLRQYTQCHFFAGIGGWSLALQLAGWPSDRPVWTGSCPCQPFSSAGKHLAENDERHLWPAFFNLIRECRPDVIFGEQVATAIGKGWLDGISTDLESENYTSGATVLGAHSVSAPHLRQRLYWVGIDRLGYSMREGREGKSFGLLGASNQNYWENHDSIQCLDGKQRRIESSTFPLANGIPERVGLLRGYGNAIVPQVAKAFIEAFVDVTHSS